MFFNAFILISCYSVLQFKLSNLACNLYLAECKHQINFPYALQSRHLDKCANYIHPIYKQSCH